MHSKKRRVSRNAESLNQIDLTNEGFNINAALQSISSQATHLLYQSSKFSPLSFSEITQGSRSQHFKIKSASVPRTTSKELRHVSVDLSNSSPSDVEHVEALTKKDGKSSSSSKPSQLRLRLKKTVPSKTKVTKLPLKKQAFHSLTVINDWYHVREAIRSLSGSWKILEQHKKSHVLECIPLQYNTAQLVVSPQSPKKFFVDAAVNTLHFPSAYSFSETYFSWSFSMSVLARSPLLSIVQKDGTLITVLFVYGRLELPSICPYAARYVKLRLCEQLALSLSFLAVEDQLDVLNFERPSSITANTMCIDVQLGTHLTSVKRVTLSKSSPTFKKFIDQRQYNQKLPVQMLVRRLGVNHSQQYRCVFYQDNNDLYVDDLEANWVGELPSAGVPCLIKTLDYEQFQTIPEMVSEEKTKTYSRYTPLALLENLAESSFYACVVDVSKMIRIITLPKYGSVAAMNIDIVDESIADTFYTGFHTTNTIKVNVLVLASSYETMPLFSAGDIIRVHRSQLSIHQDFKSGAVYLDTRNFCHSTSIRCWRLNDTLLKKAWNLRSKCSFSEIQKSVGESSDPVQNHSNFTVSIDSIEASQFSRICDADLNAVGVNTQCTITSKCTIMSAMNNEIDLLFSSLILCYWRSSIAHVSDNLSCNWIEPREKALSKDDWKQLYKLSCWVVRSLVPRCCFQNVYYMTLDKLCENNYGKYVDVVAQILSIEPLNNSESAAMRKRANLIDLPDSLCSLYNPERSQCLEEQHMNDMSLGEASLFSTLDIATPQIPIALRLKEDQIRLQIHVTDFTQCYDEGTWILTNFTPYVSLYLNNHLKIGQWIRIQNVVYIGVKQLIQPSSLLKPEEPFKNVFVLDAYRSRISLIPSFARELIL